jgi:hypothetical protein
MTTKVHVVCPDNSHCNVRVTPQDRLIDPANGNKPVWVDGDPVTLEPSQRHETYIHSGRRLMVDEVERDASGDEQLYEAQEQGDDHDERDTDGEKPEDDDAA